MTRIWLSLCAVGILAACESSAPPAQGVGFSSYEPYKYSSERARQGQLETPLELSPENTGAPAAAGQGRTNLTAQELAAAGIDISPDVRVKRPSGQILYGPAENTGPVPVYSKPKQVDPVPPSVRVSSSGSGRTPSAAAPQTAEAPVGAPLSALKPGSISDEQDFAAVAERETIESDAARRTAQGAQYTQVTQTVANRPASTGPDIVAFALSTSHAVGAKQFRRSFASAAKARRACARYTGSDQAQRAFLEAGGPQRDRLGLDPDGDGFACSWSPEPFRAARAG